MVLNSTCIKNQLVFWPSGKSNHYKADAIDFNAILTVEKKKKEKRITSTIYIYMDSRIDLECLTYFN
jgi:hypothetical protein